MSLGDAIIGNIYMKSLDTYVECSWYVKAKRFAYALNSLILQALQLTKFDYRLTNELDEELQKLRCRVNFHALRFTNSIQTLGEKLVRKLRSMSSRYVAVHLRYAFTCFFWFSFFENGTTEFFSPESTHMECFE